MKNIFFVLGLVALGISGYIMFKLLTTKEDGTDTKTNPETLRDSAEKTGKEGSPETGESVNP